MLNCNQLLYNFKIKKKNLRCSLGHVYFGKLNVSIFAFHTQDFLQRLSAVEIILGV